MKPNINFVNFAEPYGKGFGSDKIGGEGLKRLSQLSPGERGRVVRIEGEGPLGERLAAMGITVGVEVEVVRRAPLGDPLDLRVRGYRLSLRKREAEIIYVELGDEGGTANRA
ncbi:MAG: FeoA family protein [Candidatus Bipolaricaulaceae bacterium]